ncbi:MAG: alkaline phosphatase family protein [Bryobacteraceae bacterium]|nr:alkaline phosphatase family protein [Bryobacteraceae bacterium]
MPRTPRLLAPFLLLAAVSLLPAAPARKPKLLINLAVDQFRYDYLTRFRSDYTGGLKRLLERGAVYTNAHYEHFPTVTAVGHSTMLSGAMPSVSGIVGNEWYDRETKKQITSVSDDQTALLGGSGRGSSPRKMLVSTVGDELKMANGQSKLIGISSKDRSAILPVGRMANGAFWFDTSTGNFVSSTYYFPALPGWAEKFNSSRAVDQWAGKQWTPADAKGGTKAFATLGQKGQRGYYNTLDRTPFSNDLLVLFAEAAIEGENLGAGDHTDVLAVSFSANDRVGHAVGPDSPLVRDISIQTDRTLGEFFEYLDKKIGAENWMLVLTADHGVSPLPELMAQRRMPGGRIPEDTVLNAIQSALEAKYGAADWVVGKSGPAPYFNYDVINAKKLNHEEVENTAAEAVRAIPHIYRVYTRTQMRSGSILDDMVDRRVRAGFNAQRGSDLFVVAEPYWLFEEAGTSHGTPYNYDTHVPVIFIGQGIKAGRYNGRIAVNDIAPTLATMLEVETPSGSFGRVLNEMLE